MGKKKREFGVERVIFLGHEAYEVFGSLYNFL